MGYSRNIRGGFYCFGVGLLYFFVSHHHCYFHVPTFQEIDAITTQPSSENAESHSSAPEVTDQQPAAGGEKNQQNTEFAYDTQYSLAGGNCSKSKSSCLELRNDKAGLNIYQIRF